MDPLILGILEWMAMWTTEVVDQGVTTGGVNGVTRE